MKNLFLFLVIPGALIFSGCKKQDDNFKGKFGFDISAVGQSTTKSERNKSGTELSKPFCDLSKFEIELIYINVNMYDIKDLHTVSSHTLLNKKRGQGVKLDLVNEKLSDKIDLFFENPVGNYVAEIHIGIGNNIVVNGYIDSVGVKVRSSPEGFVSDGGLATDYSMGIDTATWLNLYNHYGSEALVEKNVEGISLVLPYKEDDYSVIQLESSSTLELKWLMDNAIYMWNGEWAVSARDFTTPFIEGQFVYEVYYLKRKDEAQYTEIVGGLFDNNGFVIGGMLNVSQTVGTSNKNILLSRSLFGRKMGNNYSDFFRKNEDGSIYFKVTQGNDKYSVFPEFVRGNHSGTVTRDDGALIDYDCIKAN